MTLDNGVQPIIWSGGARVEWDDQSPHRPITLNLPPNAAGKPYMPLTLSAQHRVLLDVPALELCFDCTEAFAPAAGLAPGPTGSGVQTWHHLLFQTHQIVRANGLWVESLFASDRALDWLPETDRQSIKRLIPEPMQLARPCLTKVEAEFLSRCAGTGSLAA